MDNCEICNKTFSSKQALLKHNTNIHKINKIIIDKKLICKNCNKIYSSYKSRWRHEKKCEEIKTEKQIEPTDPIEKNLVNNSVNSSYNSANHNNHSNNNSQINSHNTIINNYFTIPGEINYNTLSLEDMEYLLNSNINSAIEIIRIYNFNKKYPRNHTFCTTSLDSKYLNVYNYKTLKIDKELKEQFFHNLLVNSINSIKCIYNKYILFYPDKKDEYKETIDRITDFFNDNIFKKKNNKLFYSHANKLSYNNKDMIKNTWKKVKNNKLKDIDEDSNTCTPFTEDLNDKYPDDTENIDTDYESNDEIDNTTNNNETNQNYIDFSKYKEDPEADKTIDNETNKTNDNETDKINDTEADKTIDKLISIKKPIKILPYKLVKSYSSEDESTQKLIESEQSDEDTSNIITKIIYKKKEYILEDDKIYNIYNNSKGEIVGNCINGKVKLL